MNPAFKGPEVKVLQSAVRGLREFAHNVPISRAPSVEPARRPRLGLALGGGFARGVAHVGVLRVLVENSIPIDALTGASAGSIAAAAFASGCSIEELADAARKLRWNRYARWRFSRLGFATNERMESLLLDLLHCRTFEQLKIPLAVVAADVMTGDAVIFRDGDLILPVRASCSFPGLFAPIEYRGRILVDGAMVGSGPVAPLRDMDVDVIVGVYVTSTGTASRPTTLFQVVGESFQALQKLTQSTWKSQCDLVIEPQVLNLRWDDFGRADEVIAAGEAAARAALPELWRLLQKGGARTAAPTRLTSRHSAPVPAPCETG